MHTVVLFHQIQSGDKMKDGGFEINAEIGTKDPCGGTVTRFRRVRGRSGGGADLRLSDAVRYLLYCQSVPFSSAVIASPSKTNSPRTMSLVENFFFPARLNTSLFDVLLFTSHTLLFFFPPLLAHHKKVRRVNILSPFSRPGGPKPSVPVRAVGFIVIEHMLAVFL